MPKRALIAFATFALVATACISSVTPAVNYGTGARFVPFVVDSLDDMGQGDAVALTADGIPYVSYFGFPEKLEKGEIAIPRPFGSPTVPGVMLATSSTDGLWQRGAIEMAAPPPLLDPQGVTVPFGPVQTEDLDLTAANTNGTAVLVDSSGTVHVAWTGASQVSYGTSKLGGTATVDRVFDLGQKVTQAGPIGRPSIFLDGDGNPWISFAVETSKGVEIHAAHQEGKRWADSIAATLASCAGCPAPQPTGIGVVGASVVVVYADPAAKEVRAATLSGTTWSEASVATGVTGFGLSFSAVGDSAYAAYYTGQGTVDEATWKSGSWSTKTVSDTQDPDTTATGNLASNTAVAPADDGTVYVAWEDDGIRLSSGTDSFEPVDIGNTVSTGADPALSASSGGVVLSWYDTSGQNQMIGYLSDLTEVVVARPSPSLTTASQAPGGAKECGKDAKVALDETAQGTAFQQPCLVAAAGAPFTINFDNQDSGLQHNIAIFTNDTATDNLFRGDVITGVDTTTYDVKPLDAGSYFFHCDIHPTMTGTLAVVKGAK
jgi:plastocyanin